MKKYGTTRGNWMDDPPLLLSHLVTESNVSPQWTGILNSKGEPIYRLPNPIGFGRELNE